MTLKKTPLNEIHRSLGARMVPFGGWDMPVQYTGVIAEHKATREKAGLFDVSHMGEIEVKGMRAAEVCQHLMTNDVARLDEDGKIIYSALCYPDGGVVDDVLLHRVTAEHYIFVVNASNIEKDYAFMREHAPGGAELLNTSDDWAQLALQGPESARILKPLTDTDIDTLAYYTFREGHVAGIAGYIARTGYTGEDGFEVYVPSARAEKLWNALMEEGAPCGITPVGLGARDTLRLEAGYPLYGHELSADILPLEAGLGWVTRLEKGEFVGREALAARKEAGITRELIGLRMTERGIPREGYPVHAGERQIGLVTSGTQSPTLQTGIALALVEKGAVAVDGPLSVEIRGKKVGAQRVKTPFVPSRVLRKKS